MFLTFHVVWQALILVVALIWIREMCGRWRSDLDEFRATRELTTRLAIAGLWAATLVAFYVALRIVVRIVDRLID